MSDEYEEIEVTDFRMIGLVAAILLAAAVLISLVVIGVITIPNLDYPNPVLDFPEFIPKIELPELLTETSKGLTEELSEVVKPIDVEKPVVEQIVDPFNHTQNKPIIDLESQYDKLVNGFLRLGLEESEIKTVLDDDCVNWVINGTLTTLPEQYQESKFDTLVSAKGELCGVIPDDE